MVHRDANRRAAGAADPRGRHAGAPRRLQDRRPSRSGSTLTSTRDADSPNSVAASRSTPPSEAADGTSTSAPMPPVSKQHSASVTASPPSAQSCADRIRRRPPASTSKSLQRRSPPGRAPAARRAPARERLQVLAAAEFAEVLAEEHDVETVGGKHARQRARGVLDHADDADDRRRQNRAAVGLVVQAHVAAGDRNLERAARLAEPGDGLGELPHDLRPLRIAEVQAVGRADRHGAGARDVARRFGQRQPRALPRIEQRRIGRCRPPTSPARGRCP